MFFLKKKKEEPRKPIPIDEAQELSASGLSDRDIIKTLKNRGYSYDEIEKAMLAAVKHGVTEAEAKPTAEPTPIRAEPSPPPEEELAAPSLEDIHISPLATEEEPPETLIEEVVEGVVDEKWQNFEARYKQLESAIHSLRSEIKHFEQRIAEEKKDLPLKEYEERLDEISDKLDDLEARIGGLEKAFQQFLPSLSITHKMKKEEGKDRRQSKIPE